MTTIRITAPARRDIERLLAVSRSTFGEEAAERYRSLILRGLVMVRDDPRGAKSRPLRLAQPGVLSLHLRAVPSPVRRPRHRLIYIVDDQTVVALRVIHDRMDLQAAIR